MNLYFSTGQWSVCYKYMLILQSAMVAAKGKIMINLPTQHKLGILQGFVVEIDISSTMPAGLCRLDSER